MTKSTVLGKTLILLIAFGFVACATPRVPATPTHPPPTSTPTQTSTPVPPGPTPSFSAGVQLATQWGRRFEDAVWKGDERLVLVLQPQVSYLDNPENWLWWDTARNATALPNLEATAQAAATHEVYENLRATQEADAALGRAYFHKREYYLTCDPDQTTSVFRATSGQLIAKLAHNCYTEVDEVYKTSFVALFVLSNPPDSDELAFSDLTGLKVLRLTEGRIRTLVKNAAADFYSPGAIQYITWSPNLKQIAYLRVTKNYDTAQLGVADASGSTPPRLFETEIAIGNQLPFIRWVSDQVIASSRPGWAERALYSALTGEMLAFQPKRYSGSEELRSIPTEIDFPSPDERWLVVEWSDYVHHSYRVIDLQTATSIKLQIHSAGQMYFSHWAADSSSFYFTLYAQDTGAGGLYVFDTAQLTTTLMAENILLIWPGPSPSLFWALAASDKVASKHPAGMGLFDLQEHRWVKPPQIFLPDISNLELHQWELSSWSVAKDGKVAAVIDRDKRTLNLITADSSRVLANNLPITDPEGVGVALSPSGKFVFVNLKNEAWLLRID